MTDSECKTDIDILVECVKCQQSSPVPLRQSLMTLSTLLTTDESKNYFRECEGLKYVYNLLLRAETTNVKTATLFCLASAVEKNVFSQNMLTQKSVFCISHNILQDHSTSSKLQQAAVFFLLCLVANNGKAQNQARETGCLLDLMDIFRKLSSNKSESINEEIGPFGLITSALSMCVNNPQNELRILKLEKHLSLTVYNPEENQRLCSTLLPHIFSVVGRVSCCQILSPVLSLTGLMAASNVFNQDRVRKCGGLDVLMSCLLHLTEKGREEEDCLSTAVQVVRTLDSCLSDNDANIKKFQEACGIGPLFSMLSPGLLSQQEQLQVVITLSHVLNSNAGGLCILSAENYQTLVCLLTQSEDEELLKVLKYVLHMCKNPDGGEKTRKSQSARERESNLKQSSHLILRKIDELAAKLDMYQEESRQDPCMHDQNNSNSKPFTDSMMDDIQGRSYHFQKSREISDLVSDKIKSLFEEKPQPPLPPVCVHSQNETNLEVSAASSYLMNWFKYLIPQFIKTSQVDECKANTDKIHTTQEMWQPQQYIQSPYNHSGLNTDEQGMFYSVMSPMHENSSLCGTSRNDYVRSPCQDKSCHQLTGGIPRGTVSRIPEHTDKFYHGPSMSTYKTAYPDQEVIHKKHADIQYGSIIEYDHGHRVQIMDDKYSLSYSCPSQNQTQMPYCKDKRGLCRNNMAQTDKNDSGRCHEVVHWDYHHNSETALSKKTCTNCLTSWDITVKDKADTHHVTHSLQNGNSNTNNSNVVNSNASALGRTHVVNEVSKEGNNTTVCLNCKPNVWSDCCNRSEITTGLPGSDKSLSDEACEVFIGNPKNSRSNYENNKCDNLNQEKRTNDGGGCEPHYSCSSGIMHDDTKSVPVSDSMYKNKLQQDLNKYSLSHKDETKRGTQISEQFLSKTMSSDKKRFSKTTNTPLASVRRNSASLISTGQILTPDSIKSKISGVFKTPAAPVVFGEFLKPTDTPLRQKVKTPSTCGSVSSSTGSKHNVRVLARKPVVGIREDMVSETSMFRSSTDLLACPQVTPLPSPAHSEFDLALLKSAHRSKTRDLCKIQAPFTPSVKKLCSRSLRCWTDARPTVCPAPAYSKGLSMVNWSRLSDTDSGKSVGSHSDDSTYGPTTEEEEEMSETDENQINRSINQPDLCPGCNPPCVSSRPVLNSRTYNIALETSSCTCGRHRKMRAVEREFILRQKTQKVRPRKTRPLQELSNRNLCSSCPPARRLSVYDFPNSSGGSEFGKTHVSPPQSPVCSPAILAGGKKSRRKRKRVPYSEEEVRNLSLGVEKLSTKWNQILLTYKFHPSRTAVDLKEKYNRLVKTNENPPKGKKWSRSFSMCEERRLRRGVKILGYNWKGILQMFHFSRGRKPEELRSKWRIMMKRVKQ